MTYSNQLSISYCHMPTIPGWVSPNTVSAPVAQLEYETLPWGGRRVIKNAAYWEQLYMGEEVPQEILPPLPEEAQPEPLNTTPDSTPSLTIEPSDDIQNSESPTLEPVVATREPENELPKATTALSRHTGTYTVRRYFTSTRRVTPQTARTARNDAPQGLALCASSLERPPPKSGRNAS